MTPTIQATVYHLPNGRREEITVTKVRPEAADYINKNDVKVSMETLNIGGEAVYFDDGTMIDGEDEPNEITILSLGKKSCEDCMDEGVALLKKRKSQ